MGRKIPGKKHRTVKDPYTQKRNRFNSIKDKINNPPKKADVQEMPKSILRIMELKERAKTKKQPKHKKKGKKVEKFDMERALGKEIITPGMDRPDKKIPLLQQGPKERIHSFTNRVTRVCDDLIRETKFEEKFGVEVKRDDSGKVTEIKPTKASKRSKKPKLREKRKERIAKKLPYEVEKEFAKKETFDYGDIVHQPPTNLKIPGKKDENSAFAKPGTRNLLLKSVLDPNSPIEVVEHKKSSKKESSSIEKQKQEERRKRVVEAFRLSKKQKLL